MSYILYHYPLCPISRRIRFLLEHLSLEHELIEIKPWDLNECLPVGYSAPTLYDKNKDVSICDGYVISDFLVSKKFYGKNEFEAKRLIMLFDKEFFNDVFKTMFIEKIEKIFTNEKQSLEKIKKAQEILNYYLNYVEEILQKNDNVSSSEFTLADLTIATYLSVLDYLGEISWKKYHKMKNWYLIIKSKPAFNSILKDKIIGINPSKNYSKIDL
ncbi:MAG: glutathione S-transferase family protein [Rickettsiales bacterium]|jgi:glutathione S-transferase|nr:glutathione S-transferase family protein [Rickettsiales bacterium]